MAEARKRVKYYHSAEVVLNHSVSVRFPDNRCVYVVTIAEYGVVSSVCKVIKNHGERRVALWSSRRHHIS